jgi:hypothetical protein
VLIALLVFWKDDQDGGRPREAGSHQTAVLPSLFPDIAEEWASAAVLKTVLNEAPPSPRETYARPRLGLSIHGRRAGEEAFVPLQNGDSLASRRDRYVLLIQAFAPGYLYVFQIDSRGSASWLYPKNDSCAVSSGVNPVRADSVVQIPPSSGHALFLDDHTGTEHVFAVFSARRWEALEQALSREMPGPTTLVASGTQHAIFREATRGVGGIAEVAPSGEISCLVDGDQVRLTPTSPIYEASGPFMVVSRWFHHVD